MATNPSESPPIPISVNREHRGTIPPPGTLMRGKWLAQGSHGSVSVVHELLENPSQHQRIPTHRWACKTIPKQNLFNSACNANVVMKEVTIMEQVRHPNVVEFQNLYEDSSSYHIIMELCEGGDLMNYLPSMDGFREHVAARIFRDIIAAVDFCHSQGVVHLDLNPENILLCPVTENGQDVYKVKLADFGCAEGITGTHVKGRPSSRGSIQYCAPEMTMGKKVGTTADVFSLGVTLAVLLTGTHPVYTGTNYLSAIPAYGRQLSDRVTWLLEKMLAFDPEDRPTAAEISRSDWVRRAGRGLVPKYHLPRVDRVSQAIACDTI